MSLLDRIYDVSPRRESKADVVAAYQHHGQWIPGGKQALIRDLLERNYDVSVGTVGKEEYKRQAKNMARRFDPSRINNPERKNTKEYQTIGATLAPKAPTNGYHIFGTIYVKYSDEECEPREMDEYIKGEAAQNLIGMSAKDMLQATGRAYQSQEGDIEYEGGPYVCPDSELAVEAVDDDEAMNDDDYDEDEE